MGRMDLDSFIPEILLIPVQLFSQLVKPKVFCVSVWLSNGRNGEFFHQLVEVFRILFILR